jgi:uncharacterized phiE125 gp8 family phage protein
MPSVLVTAPTAEPVSLAEAKLHLRVDDNVDDALIAALITAARQHAEHDTRRALVTQTWKLALEAFPSEVVMLDHAPVSAVVSVVYTDPDGASQTLQASAYQLDAITEPCRLVPAYGSSWPATRAQLNAVAITYNCGYGAPEAVPESIKRWMLLRIGALYENREEVLTGRSITLAPLPFVDALLAPYRLLEY